MNTRDAAYLTGHHYLGGVPALAVRMGMDANDLSRKLNPNTGNLCLDDAIALMVMSGDHRILHAMAAEVGCVLTQLQDKGSKCAGPSGLMRSRVIRTSIIR